MIPASLRYPLFAAGLLLSAQAPAEVFDASVSGYTLGLGVSGPLAHVFDVTKGEYDVGGVFGEVEDFRKNDFFSGHLGALLTGDAGATGAKVTAGLGARVQHVDVESVEGAALALGGQLRVKLAQADRVRFNTQFYYGPRAASFGDFDEYTEFSASLGFEVLRDAELYVGYRSIELNLEHGPDVDLEDGAHVGIRLDF